MNPYAAPDSSSLIQQYDPPTRTSQPSFTTRLRQCYQCARRCHPKRWGRMTWIVVFLWVSYAGLRNWPPRDPLKPSLESRHVQKLLADEISDVSPLPVGWPFFAVRPIGWFRWNSNFTPAVSGPPGPIANFFPVVMLLNCLLIFPVVLAITFLCQSVDPGPKRYVLLSAIPGITMLSLIAHETDNLPLRRQGGPSEKPMELQLRVTVQRW